MHSDERGDPSEASTLLHASIAFSPPPSASYRLVVIEGPDQGQAFDLDGLEASRVLVGSGPACHFRLSDRSVSRRHIALGVEGKRLHISDLESKNGVFVDGVGIFDGWLRGGEIIRLGTTAIRVESGEPRRGGELPTQTGFGRLLGASVEMRKLYPLCERLAATEIAIVIEGETGTGKEVLAEALHEEGPRADKPFVVFDCTTVPANLLESELFGHERGAFTGASDRRVGLLEQADGGTLLIDEIGDLDLQLQPKLLRAIERGEFRRVGGNRNIKVDVRVLAATRRDLDREVLAGRFRDDLYHRLAIGRVELPPLRERRGDVTFLAAHFAEAFGPSSLPPGLLARWESYRWPGNVRELRNAVARYLALGELAARSPRNEGVSQAVDRGLFEEILSLELPLSEARSRLVEEFERRYVARILEKHGGNVSRAAAAAGVGRRYLHKLKAREPERK